jgi:hypothetical protein
MSYLFIINLAWGCWENIDKRIQVKLRTQIILIKYSSSMDCCEKSEEERFNG